MQSLNPSLADTLAMTLVIVLVLSVWYDVREHRLPNWLTAGGFVAALLVRGMLGWDVFLVGLGGGALGLGLGLVFFAWGAMGAGDAKLLAAVGAVLGFDTFLWCLPLVGAFGGVLAIAVTLRNGTIIPTLLRFRELLFYFVTAGRLGDRRTLATPGAVTVPYGVAVAAGAATAWLGWGLTL